MTKNLNWVVKGYAMVPVEVSIPVEAASEQEAVERAKAAFEADRKRFIVPNSVDESACHDWRWNNVDHVSSP